MKPEPFEEQAARCLADGFALRAYVVKPCSEDEVDRAVLVFAQCEATACAIGAPDMDGEPEDCEARRAPEHDERAKEYLAASVEHDPEYMRNAGWHYEGEERCGCCGLAAFGMEKYGVCRLSNLCKECGCDDAEDEDGPCGHSEGFSCE